MRPARNEFKDKQAQGQSGFRIGFGGAVLISLIILAGIGYGVHTHLEDLKAEKQLQEALELSAARTNSSNLAREEALARVRVELLKAEAAAKERDAAMKAAAESAAKVSEANRLRDEALQAEAALKKKAEDAQKIASEMEARLQHANNTAAKAEDAHKDDKKAHEELKGIANGIDD